MEQSRNPNVVPVGPGGILGKTFRAIVMICTAGFVYPNVFVEGEDLTARQRLTEGALYDVKK
jgi:hypothetical protein